MSFRKLLRRPAAVLPIAMSLLALAIVVLHVARYGPAREADEGTSAHLWQLLMAAQLPVIGFFAIKWLPQSPKPAVIVLFLQAAGVVAAAAPVFVLGL